MANKKKKVKAEKLTLVLHSPNIQIFDHVDNGKRVEVRALFVSVVAGALVREHNDLGGRDNDKIVAASFRLGDLLTEHYFNT
jgi:hypothetical protein